LFFLSSFHEELPGGKDKKGKGRNQGGKSKKKPAKDENGIYIEHDRASKKNVNQKTSCHRNILHSEERIIVSILLPKKRLIIS